MAVVLKATFLLLVLLHLLTNVETVKEIVPRRTIAAPWIFNKGKRQASNMLYKNTHIGRWREKPLLKPFPHWIQYSTRPVRRQLNEKISYGAMTHPQVLPYLPRQ